jgi:hypothetical protein
MSLSQPTGVTGTLGYGFDVATRGNATITRNLSNSAFTSNPTAVSERKG